MLTAARPWASLTPLQALVERACDPTMTEPNYGINLELAELVNTKKANTPREAAMETVRMVNNRNPHVAMLALHLLDNLVHQCGYPFHLQIATKEFLNELVRRFPERPPMMIGPVMGKTLELIHEWKNTLCVASKYKEDLVHIRDMHRLLSYKGYRFKSFDATRAMAAANPTENLKSPDELEEEDRAAKSAKLQELIRRGSPKDLAQAQELMKALSGAEPDKAPDYASQTKAELEKVQQKAILLNDMLNNVDEGEKIGVEGDAYDQVAGVCKGARPKIQKWIGEAGEENADLMDRLLLMNDLINNVLERFEACKRGDWSKAAEIDATLNPSSKPPDLINFDAFADDNNLGSLSLSSPAPGTPSVAAPASATQTIGGLPVDLFSSLAMPSSSSTSSGIPSGPSRQRQDPMAFFNTAPIQPQQQPQFNQFQQQSNSFATSSSSGAQYNGYGFPSSPSVAPHPASISLPITPGNSTPRQSQLPAASTNHPSVSAAPPPVVKKDPFADLADLF